MTHKKMSCPTWDKQMFKTCNLLTQKIICVIQINVIKHLKHCLFPDQETKDGQGTFQELN